MSESLEGRPVGFLAAEGVERVELADPWRALAECGLVRAPGASA